MDQKNRYSMANPYHPDDVAVAIQNTLGVVQAIADTDAAMQRNLIPADREAQLTGKLAEETAEKPATKEEQGMTMAASSPTAIGLSVNDEGSEAAQQAPQASQPAPRRRRRRPGHRPPTYAYEFIPPASLKDRAMEWIRSGHVKSWRTQIPEK